MRRMYSLEQLKEVAEGEVFKIVPQSAVADSGKVIQVGADGKYKLATIEGATPLYYHPVVIWGKEEGNNPGDSLSFVVLNNSATPFASLDDLIDWLESHKVSYLAPVSGSVYHSSERYIIAWIDIIYDGTAFDGFNIRCHGVSNGDVYLEQVTISKTALLSDYRIGDGANQLL